MKNLEFNQNHYEEMVKIDEDWKQQSFEELKNAVEKGAEIVDENKGFYGLETKLEPEQMICVGAFIDLAEENNILSILFLKNDKHPAVSRGVFSSINLISISLNLIELINFFI